MSCTVFATIPVKPEHMEDSSDAVASIVARRGEGDCLTFEPRWAADRSAAIDSFEEWKDRAAFVFHHSRDDTKGVFTAYEGRLQSAPRLVEVKPLES